MTVVLKGAQVFRRGAFSGGDVSVSFGDRVFRKDIVFPSSPNVSSFISWFTLSVVRSLNSYRAARRPFLSKASSISFSGALNVQINLIHNSSLNSPSLIFSMLTSPAFMRLLPLRLDNNSSQSSTIKIEFFC